MSRGVDASGHLVSQHPAGTDSAALRELVEAEERRRDDAGQRRLERAERRARAECAALGISWPETLTVGGG